MYFIAEIAHLEALKTTILDELGLMTRIMYFDLQITSLNPILDPITNLSTCAEVSSRVLVTRAMTDLFRITSRIYLWSLCPSCSPEDPKVMSLVEEVSSMMNCMPSGPNGLDCFPAWPLFIAGLSHFQRHHFGRCSENEPFSLARHQNLAPSAKSERYFLRYGKRRKKFVVMEGRRRSAGGI